MKGTGLLMVLPLLFGGCAGDTPAPAAETSAQPDTAAERLAAEAAAASDSADQAREGGALPADGWTTSPSAVQRSADSVALLLGVRTSAHEGFDRVVFDFGDRSLPSYEVAYVASPQHQCGSGDEVRLGGSAWLSVRLQPADAHDDAGNATVRERSREPGHPTLLELRLTCDFEAQVEWVAGLASARGYRVLMLQQPARLVVDVRH